MSANIVKMHASDLGVHDLYQYVTLNGTTDPNDLSARAGRFAGHLQRIEPDGNGGVIAVLGPREFPLLVYMAADSDVECLRDEV